MKQVVQGQTVRLTATFYNFSGVLSDPSEVYVWTDRLATGAVTQYSYSGGNIVRSSAGIYYLDIDTSPTGGQWNWRMQGAGTPQNTKQGSFYVEPEYNTTIMATSLLPGFGSAVDDTLSVTEGGAAQYTTTLDVSQCASVGVQITTWAGAQALTAQAQQSFDGTNWADYGSATVVVLASILRFDITSGPIGQFRVKFTEAAGTSQVSSLGVRTVGWALPVDE